MFKHLGGLLFGEAAVVLEQSYDFICESFDDSVAFSAGLVTKESGLILEDKQTLAFFEDPSLEMAYLITLVWHRVLYLFDA